MENQDDNQEGQNDVPDSDVPEFVSRAIEDIWPHRLLGSAHVA